MSAPCVDGHVALCPCHGTFRIGCAAEESNHTDARWTRRSLSVRRIWCGIRSVRIEDVDRLDCVADGQLKEVGPTSDGTTWRWQLPTAAPLLPFAVRGSVHVDNPAERAEAYGPRACSCRVASTERRDWEAPFDGVM